MSLIDLITFVVSFGLFIFLMVRKTLADWRRRRSPESVEEPFEEEVDFEEEEEEEELRVYRVPQPPPPPPPVRKKVHAKPMSLEPVHYQVVSQAAPSRAKILVNKLASPKHMVIYHEVFGPPKALRRP